MIEYLNVIKSTSEILHKLKYNFEDYVVSVEKYHKKNQRNKSQKRKKKNE